MKKRFMSMLLVLCMVFTLFPQTAFAAETGGVTIGSTAIGTASGLKIYVPKDSVQAYKSVSPILPLTQA